MRRRYLCLYYRNFFSQVGVARPTQRVYFSGIQGGFMTEAQKPADIAAVISELEKIVEGKPNNVMARHHLGLIYRQTGRIDEAVQQLEKATLVR